MKSINQPALPIESVLPELGRALEIGHEVVLVAPPGAGKTTRVPLALFEAAWLFEQKILVIEPRRIATLATAQFLAKSLGEECGQRVGYRMRLDTKVGPNTRIEVITQGVFLRMLQQDPSLEGVGAVVFDEFHERSLDSDLALAMCLQGRELLREDSPLKIIIMSATIDAKGVSELLNNAPVVISEGRMFKVTHHHVCNGPASGRMDKALYDILHNTTAQALANHQGSILVFLPGKGEIQQAQTKLADLCSEQIKLYPLYGDLPMAQQQLAIKPAALGVRKIVLATNIAETSLTIEGIDCVIDLGLYRQMAYDTRTGLSRLKTMRISKAQATQRAGRAGRLSVGHCYRLWSETQHQSLAPNTSVEMLQADLTHLCLQLHAFGCANPNDLQWMDAPPSGPWQKAQTQLLSLGALVKNGEDYSITEHGEHLGKLPLSPRLGHLLINAQHYNALPLGCALVALLSEKDPLSATSESNKEVPYDLMLRVNWLAQPAPNLPHLKSMHQRINAQAKRLMGQMPAQKTAPISHHYDKAQLAAILVALAWPERIAKQTNDFSQYKLANGNRVKCQQQRKGAPFLAVASTIGFEAGQSAITQRVCLALDLPADLFDGPLKHLTAKQTHITWHQEHGRLVAEKQVQLGKLVLHSLRMDKIAPHEKAKAICEHLKQQQLAPLNWDQAALSLQAKVQLLHQSFPNQRTQENPWPDFSVQALSASLETWLAPYLDNVSQAQDLKRLHLTPILSALLPWPLPNQLNELAPARYQVPSGNSHAIDYSQSPPVLAVKLQEMFGMQTPPSVGYGTALQVHLLAPGGQVLQVTQDLAHFWRNSYTQVKKEMKGRYPRHPWPDDPLKALATAKTNRALRSN